MKVTVFKNIFDTTEPLYVDVVTIFKRIREGSSEAIISKIRASKSDDEKNNLKKRLPSICFSGRFGKREAEFLLEHSGLMCLDIDKVAKKDLQNIKELVCKDEYVFGCFVSPGGLGLKVIVKVAPEKVNHKPQFLALEKYFNNILCDFTSTQKNEKKIKGGTKKIDESQGNYLKVHIDKSGKDVNRVCYESYDVDIYYQEDSELWCEVMEEVRVETVPVDDIELAIEKLQTWIDKKESYYEGNRNQFLYQFSSAMCRFGVGEMRAMSYLHHKYKDYPFDELETTVKGAYKANDFGIETFTEAQKRSKISAVKINTRTDVTAFWSINDKGKVAIDPDQLIEFISTEGFKIYRKDEADEKWKFVYVNNMIVDVVSVISIKDKVLEHVKKYAPKPVSVELQMKNRYFEKSFLNSLPKIEVEQIRDPESSSYIFFENFYYEVDKETATKKDYQDLDGKHIWRSQICKKTITEVVKYGKHPFAMFVYRAMGSDMARYESACSAIGYGIHTYKKKRLAKMIYACDEGIGELDGMAMGGTGKNLMLECLDYVRSVAKIDGKDFDKKDKFKFQTIADGTQVISIDDYEGDIKELFTRITGHFEIERKGLDKTVLDFSQSPKLFVSSNTAPKGFSSSYARRLHLMEFSDYYSDKRSPADEFGDKDFFSDDWTQDDWNAIYSFLFGCVRTYFKKGLKEMEVNVETQRFKQLVKNAGRDFAEYFQDVNVSEFMSGRSLLDMYVGATKEDINAQTFYGRVRRMCGIYGWKFESKGKGQNKEIRIVKTIKNE
jgi:hypothetical protein